jgi:ribosomal protein S18 acetylase RimI-like enzyme
MSNLERMIELAREAFAMQNDPDQISVDEESRARLLRIHPAVLQEERTGDGPVAWVLIFPTTTVLMNRFLNCEITENELLSLTQPGVSYDTIYLCSALVLPEFRRKGLGKRLTLRAIQAVRQQNPITSLFYWSFSGAGQHLAEVVAAEAHLPLHRRARSADQANRVTG